jgi:hypothetical protein
MPSRPYALLAVSDLMHCTLLRMAIASSCCNSVCTISTQSNIRNSPPLSIGPCPPAVHCSKMPAASSNPRVPLSCRYAVESFLMLSRNALCCECYLVTFAGYPKDLINLITLITLVILLTLLSLINPGSCGGSHGTPYPCTATLRA